LCARLVWSSRRRRRRRRRRRKSVLRLEPTALEKVLEFPLPCCSSAAWARVPLGFAREDHFLSNGCIVRRRRTEREREREREREKVEV
jgi:hypothetical protein